MTDDFWNPSLPPWLARLERAWPFVLAFLTPWLIVVMCAGTVRGPDATVGGMRVAASVDGMERVDLTLDKEVMPNDGPLRHRDSRPLREASAPPLTAEAGPTLTDIQFARSRNAKALVALRANREQGGNTTNTSESPHAPHVAAPPATPAPAAPEPPAPDPHWHPSDECAKVPAPGPGPVKLTEQTMRWCPVVAAHLAQYEWRPGDLTRIMLVIQWESGGDPYANERNWGDGPGAVFGLCSHRRRYWEARSQRFLGRSGVFYQPDQHDDIAVCVGLFKGDGGGWWHWNGAARTRLASTLANLGIGE